MVVLVTTIYVFVVFQRHVEKTKFPVKNAQAFDGEWFLAAEK
jgi:hypothetical protein